MNAARLLEHFDRISEAPDAIPKLRRFILDLAVRGKIVAQDTNDEPVSALLINIVADKRSRERLPGRRETGASTSLPTSKGPFEIPRTWTWVKLGDIVVSRDSERIPVSSQDRSERAKLFDYYGASGVIDKIDSYLFDKPLLLIGEDGANLINRTTPIAFIARGQYWVNNHAHVLDGLSEDVLRFLEIYVNAIDLLPFVTGTAQPKMNQAKMNSIPVALPPRPEQRRIVAKVDELMGLCDRLEAAQKEGERRRNWLVLRSFTSERCEPPPLSFCFQNWEHLLRQPAHLDALRDAVVALGVRGKLNTQVATDETASALLSRIWSETQRPRRARGADEDIDVPFEVPASWQWATLGDLIIDSEAGWSPKAEGFPRTGENWGVLKVSAVSWGEFLAEENKQLLPGIVPPPSTQVHAGDFLISRANTSALVAKCVVVETEPERLVLSDKIVRLRLTPHCDRHYLALVNNRVEYARAYYAKEASGTSHSMKNVSRAVIYALPVPIPPLAEQRRIVGRIRELVHLCDALEKTLTAAEAGRGGLLDVLLNDALVENSITNRGQHAR